MKQKISQQEQFIYLILLFVLVLFLSWVTACTTDKEKFVLTGKTKGIDDGDKMYLRYNNKTIDSAIIEDNNFMFSTKLDTTPVQLLVHDKTLKNYRFFWATDNSMTFDASKTDFKTAPITGSAPETLTMFLRQKIKGLEREERLEVEKEFVKNNPNSIVSISILDVYTTTWGKQQTQKLFEPMSTQNKESEFGRNVANYLSLNKQPKIGDSYVDFTSKDTDGNEKSLSDFEGKTVLLEFWASWCSPCRKENPNLVKTYKKYKPLGFEIFAVSQDGKKDSWLKAIEQDSLPWYHVSDFKGGKDDASMIYGINGIPDNFLISKDGKIIGRNLRGEELDKRLEDILN
ncbi:redoxin domain-containing protein [Winogradskyella litorisediminis]|uniref:Redoxin domain-containing protein n=1 Tax=Winogradskyella litorisediminis TaxID=1156618 RepID=A0ABW3N7E9_9FLAO